MFILICLRSRFYWLKSHLASDLLKRQQKHSNHGLRLLFNTKFGNQQRPCILEHNLLCLVVWSPSVHLQCWTPLEKFQPAFPTALSISSATSTCAWAIRLRRTTMGRAFPRGRITVGPVSPSLFRMPGRWGKLLTSVLLQITFSLVHFSAVSPLIGAYAFLGPVTFGTWPKFSQQVTEWC